MRMYDIIDKKKKGMELTAEEISYVVNGYVSDEIPDYQVSAFLMAVVTPKQNPLPLSISIFSIIAQLFVLLNNWISRSKL